MSKITAIVLTYNEEAMINDCLKSLDFCDEILVIDSGSTDKTLSIVKEHDAQVVEETSLDFSQKRNVGMEKAKYAYLLYVDADERVSPELKESILSAVSSSQFAAYTVTRQNYYLGNHPWPVTETFLRFFKKDHLLGWEGKLHETAKVRGEVGELTGNLLHYTHRDLGAMLAKTIEWSEVEAMLRFKANHPPMTWWRFPRVMLATFFRYYIKEQGWKVGTAGLIESLYQSFSMFVTYAKLWELQQQKEKL